MNDIHSVTVGTSVGTPDFSMWGLFIGADFIVQLVILALIAASFWCWTIIFSKLFTLGRIYDAGDNFDSMFWSTKSLDTLYERMSEKPKDPLSSVFSAAMREWRNALPTNKVQSPNQRAFLQQRIERVMQVTVNREMDQLERNLGFLATVGSTAPFVGLFGTVWGIMNSFQGIAMMKSTNLAVVAPGIAEALFATALGLIAAIPAVIAYNRLSTDLNRYGNRLDTFVQEFGAIISRKLDEEQ